MTALETELPRARVCGCYFHFNQALWKRVQGLGLAAAFRHDHRLAAIIPYHRTLNDAVQVRHPSLWMFLRHLKDQQQLAEEKLERADRGDPPPTRRRKWRELEARLQRLREHYIAGRRDLASFWKAVSRNVFL
ncbi:unnamed protein product [Arctogadus glacialis]